LKKREDLILFFESEIRKKEKSQETDKKMRNLITVLGQISGILTYISLSRNSHKTSKNLNIFGCRLFMALKDAKYFRNPEGNSEYKFIKDIYPDLMEHPDLKNRIDFLNIMLPQAVKGLEDRIGNLFKGNSYFKLDGLKFLNRPKSLTDLGEFVYTTRKELIESQNKIFKQMCKSWVVVSTFEMSIFKLECAIKYAKDPDNQAEIEALLAIQSNSNSKKDSVQPSGSGNIQEEFKQEITTSLPLKRSVNDLYREDTNNESKIKAFTKKKKQNETYEEIMENGSEPG